MRGLDKVDAEGLGPKFGRLTEKIAHLPRSGDFPSPSHIQLGEDLSGVHFRQKRCGEAAFGHWLLQVEKIFPGLELIHDKGVSLSSTHIPHSPPQSQTASSFCETTQRSDPQEYWCKRRTYSYSGRVHSPPPPTIGQGEKGVCVFIKTPYTACGTVGLLSYKCCNSQISLLVSNPYDYSKYSIEYALFTPDTPIPTDDKLYNKMYTELQESPSFTKKSLGKGNPSLNITKGHLFISATMSNEKKAILKIDIREV
uniref:uncharacterized protein n=1 Tax=Pristiophorus japonicus TaxID=55135 RepID=UPI00398F44BD